MICRVHKRGKRVGGLLRYLFGPGRFEEHERPRLVAAWVGAGDLADLQPMVTGSGARDFRHLVAMLEEPVRAADRPPRKPVWHASMRLAPEDRGRVFSDQIWGHMAREMLAGAGLAAHGDAEGIRWVVVRHNDDHVHIVATLVREDGRTEWARNDYRRSVAATYDVARRFGLKRRVAPADRTSARRPGPRETSKARRLGQSETTRDVLRRRVRAAVAAATSQDEFFDQLRAAGVMVKLRESTRQPGEVTGYAVALTGVHTAADGQPIYFSGGRLAPDLTLPKLRQRWGNPPLAGPQRSRVRVGRAERMRAMREAGATARAAAEEMRRTAQSDPGAAQAAAEAAADTLRAVAFAVEGRRGGPLTDAAEVFDRAARARYREAGRATTRSYQTRAMSRLISLMGRTSGNDDTLAAMRLVLDLAALGDTMARLRDAQQRLHQAQAAREAAAALRAAATSAGPLVTPASTAAATALPTVGGGPAARRAARASRPGGPR
ncbi:relaxase/mobilization nuclease domain-containing protein [Actinoplanes sp. CA-054009]